MSEQEDQVIRIEAGEQMLEVTLANPPDNRLTPEMVAGLDRAMDRFEGEPLEVLLIKGQGRSFSKGFDVAGLEAGTAGLRRMLVLSNAVFSRIARSSKPTVAALHGACMGGGLELAMACHFRLAAEKTRIGLPEVWINLVPGLGGVYRLLRLVGEAKALELVALGDLVTAEEALRLNLVSRVLPREDFAQRVGSFVKALLVADPRVIREIIRLVRLGAGQGEEDSIRESIESFARLLPCMRKN